MKTITVWFDGFPKFFKYENFYPLTLLKKHYNIIITDHKPQYVFCSNFNNYSFCKFDGIRIFMDYECYYPNLNLIDYAFLGALDLEDRDRCLRWNPAIMTLYEEEKLYNHNYTEEDVKKKKFFCNYIYSHDNYNIRTEIFKKLNAYRHVDSAGNYLNNMNGWHPGSRADASAGNKNFSKYEFLKDYKFTIAYENYQYPSYNTEKILDAFFVGSVPIYWGDKDICKIYNKNAFINAMDYDTVEEVVDVVRKIDSNNELYLNMLNQPIFNDENYIKKMKENLDFFILHIFEQDYNKAFRRPRFLLPEQENKELLAVTPYLQRKRKYPILYKLIHGISHPSIIIERLKK